jgi:hypothetical protein
VQGPAGLGAGRAASHHVTSRQHRKPHRYQRRDRPPAVTDPAKCAGVSKVPRHAEIPRYLHLNRSCLPHQPGGSAAPAQQPLNPPQTPAFPLKFVPIPRGRYATWWRRRIGPPRGCSSMVELQPSKLVMRVRFPSPALLAPGQVGRIFASVSSSMASRALTLTAPAPKASTSGSARPLSYPWSGANLPGLCQARVSCTACHIRARTSGKTAVASGQSKTPPTPADLDTRRSDPARETNSQTVVRYQEPMPLAIAKRKEAFFYL